MDRKNARSLAFGVLSFVVAAGLATAQSDTAAPRGWQTPRTSWGDPDLAGIYSNDDETGTPMERPDEFEGLDARHDHAREDRRDRRGARSPLQSAGRQRRVAQQHLAAAALDLRHVRPQQQTPLAHHRPRRRQDSGAHGGGAKRGRATGGVSTNQNSRGPFNSYHDMGLYDRCVTRGIPNSMMPAGYGSRYEIVQAPDSVAIRYEMIHEARVIPLDRRPAHRVELEAVLGRRARLVGRRHARRRDDELPRRDRAAAFERERQDDRALQAHVGRYRRMDRDVRGCEHVGAAVDVLDAAGAGRLTRSASTSTRATKAISRCATS